MVLFVVKNPELSRFVSCHRPAAPLASKRMASTIETPPLISRNVRRAVPDRVGVCEAVVERGAGPPDAACDEGGVVMCRASQPAAARALRPAGVPGVENPPWCTTCPLVMRAADRAIPELDRLLRVTTPHGLHHELTA